MPKALIIGSGMVGSALERIAPEHGWQATMLGHDDVELTDAQSVKAVVLAAAPDLVFHAAALTRVNYCEEHPKEALAVNTTGTAHVAAAAHKAQARLVYFSTDYVFDGRQSTPYDEDAAPAPLSAYGMSKLGGERYVLDYPRGTVVRTSGVFGPRLGGAERNFMRAIRDALADGDGPVEVVDDQFTAVTYAPHLARMCFHLLEQDAPALVHFTCAGEGSWYEWACQVERALYTGPSRIKPVSIKSKDTGTPRPLYSVLKSKYPEVRQIAAPYDAAEAIRDYLARLF